MKNILLQTTIPYAKDDWSIERFSLVAEYLAGLTDDAGHRLYHVTSRNRDDDSNGDDRILSKLDGSEFDQLWLFGVDVGGGLGPEDCSGITRFMQRGGGLLTSRDHQDLGISFCMLGGVGEANHFHSKNPEPDPARRAIDDTETATITWPNYHSGSNGDYQTVRTADVVHPVMRNGKNVSGVIEHLPAHPHEGAVSVPAGSNACVIATGRSQLTGREFNLAVAFDDSTEHGRALADSSFHHFLDFNFDPSNGCPTFVTEKPGRGLRENQKAMADALAYVRNIAAWLS